MLDPAGARPPVEKTPHPRRNPLCELPEPPELLVRNLDAVVVTHLHADHLDELAVELLAKDLPVLAQPPDEGVLRDRGFVDVRPVERGADLGGIAIARTGGRHGTGEIAEQLAPVSGFVVAAPGEPTLYVAGDTVWCDEVAQALDQHRPDVIVVNAGGARFTQGDPITMTANDITKVAAHAPAHLQAVHPRQHHVEHDQVGPHPVAQRDAGGPVVGDLDLEALGPQAGGNGRRDHGLVLDHADERSGHAAECARAVWDPCAGLVQVWCRIRAPCDCG